MPQAAYEIRLAGTNELTGLIWPDHACMGYVRARGWVEVIISAPPVRLYDIPSLTRESVVYRTAILEWGMFGLLGKVEYPVLFARCDGEDLELLKKKFHTDLVDEIPV